MQNPEFSMIASSTRLTLYVAVKFELNTEHRTLLKVTDHDDFFSHLAGAGLEEKFLNPLATPEASAAELEAFAGGLADSAGPGWRSSSRRIMAGRINQPPCDRRPGWHCCVSRAGWRGGEDFKRAAGECLDDYFRADARQQTPARNAGWNDLPA